ncbi:MAG: hypothetical protein EBT26_02560 [Microbacteriaceae bacterium]|jgi:hypothetical protein|nr:hypothetical protein [Microbacteriaceae bacterium]NBS60924.1 hypothetical protein [Microbacteriaceae bacterium]
MLTGHMFDSDSLQSSKRVITWHDESPYRFWIGSFRSDSGAHVLQSLEIQLVASSSLRPSKEEQKMRLKLIPNLSQGAKGLSASEFRKLPLGEILMERAEALMHSLQRESVRGNTVVLLSDQTARARGIQDSSKKISKLVSGANSDDAILIAKIYTDHCSISTVRAAQRTAEYLKVDTNIVHVALKIARRNEWLTSSGSGKAGGQLTKKGEEEFVNSNGIAREKAIQKVRGSK